MQLPLLGMDSHGNNRTIANPLYKRDGCIYAWHIWVMGAHIINCVQRMPGFDVISVFVSVLCVCVLMHDRMPATSYAY